MLTTLVLPAPAKLNLFLHITGRRADGYHELQTLFQFVEYGDELCFEMHSPEHDENSEIQLVSNVPELGNDDNLIIKAARMLRQESGVKKGVKISLDKRLPMGGGVGGGSSDAATALLGLNALWNLGFNEDQLAHMGLKLGADVPVFVRGKSAFAEGVGEVLQPVEPDENWYLVLIPDIHVNTAAMFRHKELTRDTSPIKVCAALGQGFQNDFEPLVRRLYPEVDKSLTLLDNFGSSSINRAMMSGSGSCVFAAFSSHEQALETQVALALHIDSAVNSFVTRGVNCSPLHTSLSYYGYTVPK